MPTPHDASILAARFGWVARRVVAATRGFSGAAVFRVDAEPHSIAVRFWPEETNPRRLAALHQFLDVLAPSSHGRVAPPLREPRTGGTFVRVGGRLAQVERWLPGDPPSEPLTAETVADIAQLLARLHVAAAAYEAPGCEWFGPRRGCSPSLQLRAAESERVLNRRPLVGGQAAYDLLRAENVRLQEAARTQRPLRPCLRDLWSDSVLLTGGRVTGLIDLSAARADDPAGDLARLFGSLAGPDVRLLSRLLDAYAVQAAVDRTAVELFDHTGVALSLLLWLEKCADGRADAADPRVRQRVEHFSARLKSFRGFA